MTATEYKTHPDFLATCRFWQANGYAPLPFADWFDEHELPGQAAGWRWAAGGYDGASRTFVPHYNGGQWAWDYTQALAIAGQMMLNTRHDRRAHDFPMAVSLLLDTWADRGLSVEQLEATRSLLTSAEQVRTLGGFAGTGKSRVVQHLHHARPDYAVVAFTGKAVDVLRKLGIGRAATIHSTVYDREGTEPNVRWVRRSKAALGSIRGFIIDEASMVSKAEFDVLVSYGLPIIAVGDHGQLPPVGEDAGLMREPMVRLETVHRNAGPIALFAEHLRRGGRPMEWDGRETDDIMGVYRQEVNTHVPLPAYVCRSIPDRSLLVADQIICGRNKTRVALNRKVRALRGDGLGSPGWPDGPIIGDRIICTRNHRGYGVFNGQQGVIAGLGRDWLTWRTGSGPGEEISGEIPYHPDAWHSEKGIKDDDRARRLVPFDYAYAVTAHKAQGSEFDKVVVFEERLPQTDPARWNYTAASRAKKAVIWVTG